MPLERRAQRTLRPGKKKGASSIGFWEHFRVGTVESQARNYLKHAERNFPKKGLSEMRANILDNIKAVLAGAERGELYLSAKKIAQINQIKIAIERNDVEALHKLFKQLRS